MVFMGSRTRPIGSVDKTLLFREKTIEKFPL
jgi:hypothetical protein